MELITEQKSKVEISNGYKLSDFGLIPEDWVVKQIASEIDLLTGFPFPSSKYTKSGIKLLRGSNVKRGSIDWSDEITQYWDVITPELKQYYLKENDIVIAMDGSLVGRSFGQIKSIDLPVILLQRVARIRSNKIDVGYLKEFICSKYFTKHCDAVKTSSAIPHISPGDISSFRIPLPPSIKEQTAIATALSDADALISSLEKLIVKKKLIKQGAMQELLRPKEGWVVKSLGEITVCLDNLRIPLNDNERSKMKGDFPYCGANGIVDYINDYCIDDDIILMAEDGGYFDEYSSRPIAYKINGKCWVNNHAHILKAKTEFDQNFIYYSLVHKNILSYLASGTRAKLNKSEMNKIEIAVPISKHVQLTISNTLQLLDQEICNLNTQIKKYHNIKQGMMQDLLTGRVRLV